MSAEGPTRFNEHPLKITTAAQFHSFYSPGLQITINFDSDSQDPYASISRSKLAYPLFKFFGYILVQDINGKKGTKAVWPAYKMRALR